MRRSTATGRWVHARGALDLASPQVMAIVNLTPDSFFDGGHLVPEAGVMANLTMAIRRCARLIEDGASILDLGGESTRPGAAAVPPELEARRVVPVIARLVEVGVGAPISVDTRRASVARAAVAAGAAIINDVSGLADPEMAAVAAESGAGFVIGHMRGEPATMQEAIAFRDLIGEIGDELAAGVERAVAAGVARERIVVDPCVGFGKTEEQSAARGWRRAGPTDRGAGADRGEPQVVPRVDHRAACRRATGRERGRVAGRDRAGGQRGAGARRCGDG